MKIFIILSIALAVNSASTSFPRFDKENDEVQECPSAAYRIPIDVSITWPDTKDIIEKSGEQDLIKLVAVIEKKLKCYFWHQNKTGKN